MIRVRHLCISPGHNYYRHRNQAGPHPIVEVNQVECVAGRGLHRDGCFVNGNSPANRDAKL